MRIALVVLLAVQAGVLDDPKFSGPDVIMLKVMSGDLQVEVRQTGCTIVRGYGYKWTVKDETCRALIEIYLPKPK